MSEEEEQNRFSLRKLSIGLASVLVGVSIFGTSQTVKADTVANNQTSSVTSNAQSSDTQENGNAVKSSFSNDNQANNAKSNLIQTQVEGKNEQKQVQTENGQQDSVSKTQEANDSNDLDAEKGVVRTSSLQKTNNQSNNHAEDNSQTQNEQKLDLTKNSPKFAKKVLATNLIATPPMTNGGFDEATWGKLDVNDWQGGVQGDYYQLTDYTGDANHVIVPNEADFAQAGISTSGKQVGVTSDLMHTIFRDKTTAQDATVAFSKTGNKQVKAIDTDWHNTWGHSDNYINGSWIRSKGTLTKFDGSNLDVANVTTMSNMFADNQISDLSPLSSWKVNNVTTMSSMFENNQISDLTPLASWNTSNITNMSNMFYHNQISDLKPLTNWNTGSVTDMSSLFIYNQISDLSPLANWKAGNVTDMSRMFYGNQISDLSPLANWNTGGVTDMDLMLAYNQISDLSPLANWNTGSVTDMNSLFMYNQISDLSPLANWNTSNVTDIADMFFGNQIGDLRPLAGWNTGKVTDMSYMFTRNPDLIDLKPIANWNISSVKDDNGLFSLFGDDTKLNLTNINDTPLMKAFLKEPNALSSATFITNNADLVKATINKDLPDSTNTAKRTITFNIPDATPRTIVQTINYKAITTVQVNFDGQKIVKTYPVKESDWQLDTSNQNDAIIVNGQIHFKAVKIPHVNGYKAYIVPNKSNPALFTVSFIAVPTENKPSTPVEATPSKPSAPTDNSSNSAWTGLEHKVVNALNQSDSGWTMPENNSTYTVEVPDDAIIDLSDLVIAEPVHAQTRVKLAVTKHFKLSKKHVAKHLKHRKKAVKSFKKYRL